MSVDQHWRYHWGGWRILTGIQQHAEDLGFPRLANGEDALCSRLTVKYKEDINVRHTWWCTFVTPTAGTLRQEDCGLKAYPTQ